MAGRNAPLCDCRAAVVALAHIAEKKRPRAVVKPGHSHCAAGRRAGEKGGMTFAPDLPHFCCERFTRVIGLILLREAKQNVAVDVAREIARDFALQNANRENAATGQCALGPPFVTLFESREIHAVAGQKKRPRREASGVAVREHLLKTEQDGCAPDLSGAGVVGLRQGAGRVCGAYRCGLRTRALYGRGLCWRDRDWQLDDGRGLERRHRTYRSSQDRRSGRDRGGVILNAADATKNTVKTKGNYFEQGKR